MSEAEKMLPVDNVPGLLLPAEFVEKKLQEELEAKRREYRRLLKRLAKGSWIQTVCFVCGKGPIDKVTLYVNGEKEYCKPHIPLL